MRRSPRTARAAAVALWAALSLAVALWVALTAATTLWPDVPDLERHPTAPPELVSPEVHPDRTVTFRLYAPKAGAVILDYEEYGLLHRPMARDEPMLAAGSAGTAAPRRVPPADEARLEADGPRRDWSPRGATDGPATRYAGGTTAPRGIADAGGVGCVTNTGARGPLNGVGSKR